MSVERGLARGRPPGEKAQVKRQEPTQKKPYRKPELREYGDVQALTENKLGSMGVLDGGTYASQSLKTAC